MSDVWIQAFTGRCVDPFNLRPEDIDIRDIAHALAHTCRFGGHCRVFYSVAEHSIRVAKWLADSGQDTTTILCGLLHDAAEAYLVDLPTPLKAVTLTGGVGVPTGSWSTIEGAITDDIHDAMGAMSGGTAWKSIHKADKVLLVTEARDLLQPPRRPWNIDAEPLDNVIVWPMSPIEAEREFLRHYDELQCRIAMENGDG